MEEVLAFNQHGPFDFSFGCFNSAAIQNTRDEDSSFTFYKFQTSICFHSMLQAQVDILACTMLQRCVEIKWKVNNNLTFYIFFVELHWNGVVAQYTKANNHSSNYRRKRKRKKQEKGYVMSLCLWHKYVH